MPNKFTTMEYWDKFWWEVTLPQRVDMNFSNDYAIADFIIENVPQAWGHSKTALEVGCAPGKWMVFLKEEMGYTPHGCEYVHSAAEATKRNLEMNNIHGAKVIEEDFISYDFGEQKYDLIVSFGFIEHFDNPGYIIHKMKYLLKPNGILIVGIPNFNGLNYYFAKGAGLLPNHNLRVMRKGFLKSFPLKSINIRHVGGFEPAMYDITNKPRLYKILYYLCIIKYSNWVARTISMGWYSSYIMAAYKND
jgi:2-polyprenyl-3-methyl-5-hydroxy-6-metoxy-1,4-benzoquinol methylase